MTAKKAKKHSPIKKAKKTKTTTKKAKKIASSKIKKLSGAFGYEDFFMTREGGINPP